MALRLAPAASEPMPRLNGLGFERSELPLPPGMSGGAWLWKAFRRRLANYAARCVFPALEATSRLYVHLWFGTVSIRELVRHARAQRGRGAQIWLSELIWREFFCAILAVRPDVAASAISRKSCSTMTSPRFEAIRAR